MEHVASTTSYTYEDRDSAIAKLRNASLRFDPAKVITVHTTRGFEEYLAIEQFVDQIKRSFEVLLTKEEVINKNQLGVS